MSAPQHVCRWGEVEIWTPPSARRTGAQDADRIPYRRCECGASVWGAAADDPEVLARLAVPAAAGSR